MRKISKILRLLSVAALSCAVATPSIFQADLTGFPDNYRFYASQTGQLLLTTQHSGHFLIDTDTGAGLLTVTLEIIGGPEASNYGGNGAIHTGQVGVYMPPSQAGSILSLIDALPNQTDWWGDDMANSIHVDVAGCIQIGPIGLGCATTPMLAFYKHHNAPLLNFWVDWSTLLGRKGAVWSGDAVFELYPIPEEPGGQVPEPSTLTLIAVGVGLVGCAKLRKSGCGAAR